MLRFGLLGTGYWAAETQAAGLAEHPDARFVGVWGRNPARVRALADRYAVRGYADVDALLADVDAVAVALPPDVQAPLAVRAARAGRHLLLDKPVALTVEAADGIVAALDAGGLSSLVFTTNRYRPEGTRWRRSGSRWPGWRATSPTGSPAIRWTSARDATPWPSWPPRRPRPTKAGPFGCRRLARSVLGCTPCRTRSPTSPPARP